MSFIFFSAVQYGKGFSGSSLYVFTCGSHKTWRHSNSGMISVGVIRHTWRHGNSCVFSVGDHLKFYKIPVQLQGAEQQTF